MCGLKGMFLKEQLKINNKTGEVNSILPNSRSSASSWLVFCAFKQRLVFKGGISSKEKNIMS